MTTKFLLCCIIFLTSATNSSSAEAIKPKISWLQHSSIPMGCSLIVDDWRGNALAWAPYSSQNNKNERGLIMQIDGETREIPINHYSEKVLSAYDGKYYIEISTPQWAQAAAELAQAKANIKVRNTAAYSETYITARAAKGC